MAKSAIRHYGNNTIVSLKTASGESFSLGEEHPLGGNIIGIYCTFVRGVPDEFYSVMWYVVDFFNGELESHVLVSPRNVCDITIVSDESVDKYMENRRAVISDLKRVEKEIAAVKSITKDGVVAAANEQHDVNPR